MPVFVVTRRRPAGNALVAALGPSWRVLEVPVTEQRVCQAGVSQLRTACAAASLDAVFVTSGFAAIQLAQVLDGQASATATPRRREPRLFAVGAQSAAPLAPRHVTLASQPTGEGLAQTMVASLPAGQQIYWPRAADALTGPETILRAAGHTVTSVVVYETVSRPMDAYLASLSLALRDAMAAREPVVWAVYAPSAARSLHALWPVLASCLGSLTLRIVAVGATTAEACAALGMVAWEAEAPTDEAMAAAAHAVLAAR